MAHTLTDENNNNDDYAAGRRARRAAGPGSGSGSGSGIEVGARAGSEAGGVRAGTGGPRARQLVQSSFEGLGREDRIYATKNGFVHAVMEAYNEHHRLVIRPEDVWFAILTQLGSYINAHAEDLRDVLLLPNDGDDGRIHLHIEADLKGGGGGGNSPSVDHGRMAHAMTALMARRFRDEDLRDWVQPAFTTTTKADQAVASVIFMGAMQRYFTYSWGTRCGVPTATLLGAESDWVRVRQRAERLARFDAGDGEPARWLRLLRPVLDGLVRCFRDPTSDASTRFWQSVCDEHVPNGSGATTYSGWITAFCFWDEAGRCLHGPPSPSYSSPPSSPTVPPVRLTRGQLPIGFTKVPVTLLDDGLTIPAEMIAGSLAMRASAAPTECVKGGAVSVPGPDRRPIDTLRPVTGWFMYKT